jgi:tetratricopeptide (TPR) repeat protein
MKKLLGPILLTLLLSSSPAAQTQRGGGVRILNERGEVESVRLYEGSYALVVGAVNYKYWPRLDGVRRDVPAVRTVLERHGFKVEEVLDPTGDVLLARINKFINDHGLYPDNRLLIYFSGHGYTEVSGDGRKFGYIVPVDAPKPENDIIGFQQKSLTMDEIETAARRIRSKHALFVFDSCFSGTLVNRGGLHVPTVIDYYATRPVRQFITAGSDNQPVPEESVFRQVFVRGLEGKADQNNDGYVTGTELATYVQEQVLYYRGESQTPQYGKIRDPRLDSGDFIFILSNSMPEHVPGNKAADLAAQAMAKMMWGDFEEAARVANQSLSLDNTVALAYAVRGRSLYLLGNAATGEKDLDKAMQLDKRSGVSRALLSSLYSNQGKDKLSLARAEEALRLLAGADDETEFYARGLAYLLVGNYAASIADCDKAVALNRLNVGAYVNRGLAYKAVGDYDHALSDFDNAIRLNPRNAVPYVGRGLTYYAKGDYGQAIAEYTKAVDLSPQHASIYINRGLAHQNKGEYDLALADYDTAIRLNPQHPIAHSNRATVYFLRRDYDRAVANYDTAIRLQPDDAYFHFNRGLAYESKGTHDLAVADYSEAIRLKPDYHDAYRNRARVYEKVGDTAKAQADRDKTAELEKRAVKP